VYVAFQGRGADCPTPRRDNDLTVLKIRGGSPPSITTAWCGTFRGEGSPVVTTTDGHSNPIVWILGAEETERQRSYPTAWILGAKGDERLHGYRGDTGEPLFTGGEAGDAMAGLRHFQTLIAIGDRLYVGADGRLYAFSF
jgi:hypothetical protein